MAAKLGSGARFKKLKNKLARRGVRNPRALAAWIGQRKYGARKMAKLSAKGRMHKALSESLAALFEANEILKAVPTDADRRHDDDERRKKRKRQKKLAIPLLD